MINIKMQPQDTKKLSPKITVIGVGGAGGNAVNNMISSNLEGVDFVVCNTDSQALESNLCGEKLQIGTTVTGGLGAGARPEVGRAAAEESLDDIMHRVDGANMAFITAGMGGGTGTGAAPVIAQHCREQGLLTVGVVTKPFHFEGTHRMKQAEAGISEMQKYVDTLIVIPNQNLFRIANDKTTFADAFKMADGVLQSGVRGITDLMVMPGLINLDFADIRSAMQEMGKAMMGTGESEGDKRATEAAEAAISNPLLDDVTMKGAKGLIINITGGNDMTLFEVDEACNRIRDEVDPNANIIFGSTFDDKLEGRIRVSIVATGIDAQSARKTPPVTTTTSTGSGVPGKIINERTKEQAETKSETETKTEGSSDEAPSLFDTNTSAETAMSQAEQEPIITNSGALRGSVQEGNFIPPMPMQATGDSEQEYNTPQNQMPAAPQAMRPEQSQTSKRKAPGFFERLTGGMRQEQSQQAPEPSYTPTQAPQTQQPTMPTEGFPETAPAAPSYTQRPMTGSGGQGLAQQPEYQGQLQSQTQDSVDEELDIPAFLRRQAS